MTMSTPHGAAWMRHTEAYLQEPDLIKVFRLAMRQAGFPAVSAAAALESICADFLAGAPQAQGDHRCLTRSGKPLSATSPR